MYTESPNCRAPDYFDPNLLRKEVGSNWILKVNNVKKLLENLNLFYQKELGQTVGVVVDAPLVAREKGFIHKDSHSRR